MRTAALSAFCVFLCDAEYDSVAGHVWRTVRTSAWARLASYTLQLQMEAGILDSARDFGGRR